MNLQELRKRDFQNAMITENIQTAARQLNLPVFTIHNDGSYVPVRMDGNEMLIHSADHFTTLTVIIDARSQLDTDDLEEVIRLKGKLSLCADEDAEETLYTMNGIQTVKALHKLVVFCGADDTPTMENPVEENELPAEEWRLWKAVYTICCQYGTPHTVYTLSGEELGAFANSDENFYPETEKNMPEQDFALHLIRHGIRKWETMTEKEKTDFSVILRRCRRAVTLRKGECPLFEEWYSEYYFPEDAYANLSIHYDEAGKTYWLWNRNDEETLIEYLTPDENEDETITVYYNRINDK